MMDPRDKNGLGEHLSSRNDTVMDEPMRRAGGQVVDNN